MLKSWSGTSSLAGILEKDASRTLVAGSPASVATAGGEQSPTFTPLSPYATPREFRGWTPKKEAALEKNILYWVLVPLSTFLVLCIWSGGLWQDAHQGRQHGLGKQGPSPPSELPMGAGATPGTAMPGLVASVPVTDMEPERRGGEVKCTVEEQSLLSGLQGASLSELFAKANECGHQNVRLGWEISFDHDGFLGCLSGYWNAVSSRCYECFLADAIYSANNCKGPCLFSWCAPQCLECVHGNGAEVAQCLGLPEGLRPEPC